MTFDYFFRRQIILISIKKEEKIMLGIEDKYVAVVYLLCVASALLCVVYGLLNWNRGADEAKTEDVSWAREEKKIEDEL